ncbi:MAG: D-alanine--D-alanine ligase [Thermoanaerobaculales bacterium]
MALSIGLVYDLKDDYLRAGFSPEAVMEFDSEDTIAGLEGALTSLGYRLERVGRGLELARRLAVGERWDLVFNFAEGTWGRSREAQVPALCELYDQPYTFADPLTCALTLDKAMAKRVVRDHGLATAPFAVVATADDAEAVELPPPLFVKPVAEGSSKGVTGRSLVRERRELPAVCAEMLERFAQPVLVETFLPGREVTVGLVGHSATARVIGVMEVGFTDKAETAAYTALNKDEYLDRVAYRLIDREPLAEQARQLALAVFAALGCRDAARVDVRCDAVGVPHFLEVNPLPGLNLVRSDLPIMARLGGMPFAQLIGEIVASARERYGL